IVILCIVCAFVGSIVGGLITGIMMRSKNNDAQSAVNTTQQTETTVIQQETAISLNPSEEIITSVDTTENDEDKILSGTFTSDEEKPGDDKVYSAKEIYQNNVESVVSIEVRSNYSKGFGTGFIISEEGYIVTNYHVVENARECYVTLYDDSVYTAEIVGYEETNDIAVIKIKPQGTIHSLVYGNSSALSVGDNVYVIGNPLGDLTFTLTNGVVSALNRLIETDDGISINMFQTNAAINSGNSGGPVFDEHGYVVGIASAKYAAASIEGLSFCIPIDDVRSMIDEIINKGYVSGKPVLGVSACDREVENYGFIQRSRSIGGVKLVIVESGSAADRAGLKVGDIIVSADSTKITSVSELKTVLTGYRSGDIITLDIIRDGVRYNVSLILGEYSPAQPRTNYSYVYDL
ncbi:MAG: trypsin-like peptidase domain-containing protein, partial [Clostridia bacterium]|nr:trypsin-like peptidase domain-containing protein [Clostridia bacterium]